MFTSTMQVETSGTIRLIVAGEFDLAARDDCEAALEKARRISDRLLIDLSGLEFLDCAGLACLFKAGRPAHLRGDRVTLLDPQGQVRRLLDLVGAPAGVTIVDHDGEAPRPARVAA